MNKITKQLLTGVVALGLLAPATTSVLSPVKTIVNAKRHHKHYHHRHNKKSYYISNYRAKKDAIKAFHRLKYNAGLHVTHHSYNQIKFKTMTGTLEYDYLSITKYGHYAHIRWSQYGNFNGRLKHVKTVYKIVRY